MKRFDIEYWNGTVGGVRVVALRRTYKFIIWSLGANSAMMRSPT
jgi:hypothetical protein